MEVREGVARVDLAMSTHSREAADQVKHKVETALAALDGIDAAEVSLSVSQPPSAQEAVSQQPNLIPGIRHVIAVASGKGGVGKSTVASNLAIRLGQLGHRVGLLDADIYGPSIPMMFGVHEKPRVEDNRLFPFERHGIRIMSLGFILEVDTPVIWRGPMVMKALEQLLRDVVWGSLDYMILDLPPGTGDAQLTLTQRVKLSGAVIVSTPQDVAVADAVKGVAMFRKVNVPILGLVENMSFFDCPHCSKRTEVFGHGGAKDRAAALGVPFLAELALDPAICETGDAGAPIVDSAPESTAARTFDRLASSVAEKIAGGGAKDSPGFLARAAKKLGLRNGD